MKTNEKKTKNLIKKTNNQAASIWKDYFLTFSFSKKTDQIAIKTITEAGLIIALTFVFHYLTKIISKAFWPQGGNIGFWMIPLILYAARHKFLNSCMVCMIYGLLLLLTSNDSFNPYDILMEYVFGFMVFATPSLLRFIIKDKAKKPPPYYMLEYIFGYRALATPTLLKFLTKHKHFLPAEKTNRQKIVPYYIFFFLSVLIAGGLYFTVTFIAGFVFYAEFTPASYASVYLYSFVYNISYIGPSMLLSLAILWVGIKQFRHMIYVD